MDIRQLQNVLVLADELHFRRAAETLDTAQPTLSQRISALEKELGVQLFDRTKREVHLTKAGRVFVDNVRPLVDQLDQAVRRTREAQAGMQGTLLLGASTPAMSNLVPALVRQFRRLHPQITLALRVMHSNELVEQLRRRQIDVAFGRAGIPAEKISSELIMSYPHRLMLPADHDQAGTGAVELSRLQGETLVTYPRSVIGDSYDELLTFCRTHSFIPKAIQEAPTVDSVIGLVSCGFGVAILPATRALQAGDIVSRSIAGARSWRFGISAYWRTHEHSPLLQKLLAVAHGLRRASA